MSGIEWKLSDGEKIFVYNFDPIFVLRDFSFDFASVSLLSEGVPGAVPCSSQKQCLAPGLSSSLLFSALSFLVEADTGEIFDFACFMWTFRLRTSPLPLSGQGGCQAAGLRSFSRWRWGGHRMISTKKYLSLVFQPSALDSVRNGTEIPQIFKLNFGAS